MNSKAQQGAVLIVGLILLLLMTLIGVSASTIAVFDEHLGSSLRDKDASFQAAEAAISAGENFIELNQTNLPIINTVKTASNKIVVGQVSCKTGAGSSIWSNDNSVALTTREYDATNGGNEPALVQPPRFALEKVASVQDNLADPRSLKTDTFRVTAFGTGRAKNALDAARSSTTLQTYYSVTHN